MYLPACCADALPDPSALGQTLQGRRRQGRGVKQQAAVRVMPAGRGRQSRSVEQQGAGKDTPAGQTLCRQPLSVPNLQALPSHFLQLS